MNYDVMVIGAGIAGMEAAVSLGDMGYKVLLVEKEPSIGGKMVLLSKVFPTLDCASCISTPKMAQADNHANIDLRVFSEVREIRREGRGRFKVRVAQKPAFVDFSKCIGCQECEKVCPIPVPDEFNEGLVSRRAVFIAFPQAVPKKALIDRDFCTYFKTGKCKLCQKICPADAIDFDQREMIDEHDVAAVVLATGFSLFPPGLMETYGFGRLANVVTAMQMERLIAPTRPFNHVLRPGDGRQPSNMAYVFCAGSRDRTLKNPICSRVCCMYSLKQAQLLLGALPIADVTLYYIDIRAFGKGYDEFFEQTRAMGVRLVKGKIAKITEKENGNLLVRYEDIDEAGAVHEAEHDLVVLSTGVIPGGDPSRLFAGEVLAVDETLFVAQPGKQVDPARTSIPGVFSAGTATGPLDIPDSILSAGAAAAQTAAYLARRERNY